MLIRHEFKTRGQGLGHNLRSSRVAIGLRWKILITPENGALVPFTNAFIVSIGDVDLTSRIYRDKGMGVIHDRRAILGARRKVMRETQGVAHLMGRKLPNARQRKGFQPVDLRVVIVGGQ